VLSIDDFIFIHGVCVSRSRTRMTSRYRSDGDDHDDALSFVIIGMDSATRHLRVSASFVAIAARARREKQRGEKGDRSSLTNDLGVISSPVRGAAERILARDVRRYVISCVGCSRARLAGF